MSEIPLTQRLFASAGVNVTEAPRVAIAECIIGARDSIQFNPTDPESVIWARETAIKQAAPRFCGEACPTAPIPCGLRMLEDDNYSYLMRVFDKK